MERVEECVSFLVGKAAQRISRRAKELLAPHDVTPPQYAVLKVLFDGDGLSAREIGPLDVAMDQLNEEARALLGESAGVVYEGLKALSGR